MKMINKQTFDEIPVDLDDTIFTDCVFRKAVLHFSGGEVQMHRCQLFNCQVLFSGAADRTLTFARNFGWHPPQGWDGSVTTPEGPVN